MPYIVREVCCYANALLMCFYDDAKILLLCGNQVERYPVHLSQQPQKEAHPPTHIASVKSAKNKVGTWGKQDDPTSLRAPQPPPPSLPLYRQEGAGLPIMAAGAPGMEMFEPGMEMFEPTSPGEKLRWQEQQAVMNLMRASKQLSPPATSTSLQV